MALFCQRQAAVTDCCPVLHQERAQLGAAGEALTRLGMKREALQQKQERIQRLMEAQHANLEQVLKRAGGPTETLAATYGGHCGNVQESGHSTGGDAWWEPVWPCLKPVQWSPEECARSSYLADPS